MNQMNQMEDKREDDSTRWWLEWSYLAFAIETDLIEYVES